MEGFLKLSTATNITILMIDSADHVTGKTGLSAGLTIYATKAAGTPGAITPTVTELDSTNVKGVYKLALTSSHIDTLGEFELHITASGADPVDLKWQVSTYLPGEAATLQADQAVNTTKFGGTTVTGRDIGASVLLSSGAGTGQLDFTSGVVKANLAQILGTALTETAGQIAAGFKKVFDVASPVFTAASVNQTGDSYARLGAPAGASVSADVAAVKSDSGAIKTQTDKLAFTVTNQVDANVLDWKSATAPAMTGDAYARLGAPAGASVSADIAGVQSDTDDIQTRIPSALAADGSIKASLQSILGTAFTEGASGRIAAAFKQFFNIGTPAATMDHGILVDTVTTATTATNLTNAPTNGDLTTAMKASVNAEADTALADVGLTGTVTGRIDAAVSSRAVAGDAMALTSGERTTLAGVIWAALTSGMTTAGSIGKKLADWVVGTIDTYTGNTKQTGDAFARLGAPAGASIAADLAEIEAETDGIAAIPTGDTSGVTTLLTRIPGTIQPQTGDSYARLGAPAGASIAADLAEIEAETDDIAGLNNLSAAQVKAQADQALADVGLTSTVTSRVDVATSSRLATSGYTVPPTTAQIEAAIAAGIIENGISRVEAERAMLDAIALGEVEVDTMTGTVTIKSADGLTDRVIADCDTDGNRANVVRDLS